MREFQKLILNSFWGKLGELEIKQQTSILKNKKELQALIDNPDITIKDIYMPPNSQHMLVCFEETLGNLLNKKSPILIASYVTGLARIKLYSYMTQLQPCQIIYVDTDSLIWIRNQKKWPNRNIKTDIYLGCMVDEYPDNRILEFAGGSPKHYSILLERPDKNGNFTKTVLKGFRTGHTISHNTVVDLVRKKGKFKDIGICDNTFFVRDKKTNQIYLKKMVKKYGFQFSKRVIRGDFETEPFGFKKAATDI